MTIPFAFPDVTPRTTLQRNEIDDFAQLLLGVHKMRQDFALQSEGLALERRRTEESEEMGASQRKRTNADLDDRQAEIDAREIATRYLPLVLAPGGATTENLATQRVRLLEEAGKDKKRNLGVRALAAFDVAVADAEKARGEMARRRTGEVAADVAEQTRGAQITAGNLQDDIAKQELALRTVQTKMESLRAAGFDAARINAANEAMRLGMSWGEARRINGIGPIAGVADDFRVTPPAGEGGALAKQRDDYVTMMDLANATLGELGNGGLNALGYVNLSTGSLAVDMITSAPMSEEQRNLSQAYSLFVSAFNRLISGANASDKEGMLSRRTFITRSTDPEGTRKQKELLRQALPIVLKNNPSEPASVQLAALIAAGERQKVDAKLLAPLKTLQKRAEATERTTRGRAGAPHTPSPAASPNAALLRSNGIGVP